MHSNWQYLQRGQVNASKWDECISTAENGRVYALAEYLDHTSEHWDALIYGDYEMVIPLPWKQKYGIRYVYAPPFIQHLGVFGNSTNTELIAEGIKIVSRRFRWIDYNVNDSFADKVGRTNIKIRVIPRTASSS